MTKDEGLSFGAQLKIKFLPPNNTSKKCLEKSLPPYKFLALINKNREKNTAVELQYNSFKMKILEYVSLTFSDEINFHVNKF